MELPGLKEFSAGTQEFLGSSLFSLNHSLDTVHQEL